MENHLVLYQAGHCGTYLVWLINQHKNFSQYPFQWKYTEAGDKLDLGCFGSDWYVEETSFSESREEWETEYWMYPESRDTEWQPRVPGNFDRTKDAIKILPNHLCQSELVYFNGKIDETLLEKVMDEMNPKTIIIPIAETHLKNEILNRWIAWRKKNIPPEKLHVIDKKKNPIWAWDQLWWNKIFPWLKENYKRYGDNAHIIDIGKIIMSDEPEYLKLCAIIDEEPLEDIKELTRPMREMMESYKN